jgi:hypothetical protein
LPVSTASNHFMLAHSANSGGENTYRKNENKK